jgi:hypothetical protein
MAAAVGQFCHDPLRGVAGRAAPEHHVQVSHCVEGRCPGCAGEGNSAAPSLARQYSRCPEREGAPSPSGGDPASGRRLQAEIGRPEPGERASGVGAAQSVLVRSACPQARLRLAQRNNSLMRTRGNADQHDPSRRVRPIPGRVVDGQRPVSQSSSSGLVASNRDHLALKRQAPRRANRRTREKTEILRPRYRIHMIDVHTRRVGRPHKKSGRSLRPEPPLTGSARRWRSPHAPGAARPGPPGRALTRAARAAAQPVRADTPHRDGTARGAWPAP